MVTTPIIAKTLQRGQDLEVIDQRSSQMKLSNARQNNNKCPRQKVAPRDKSCPAEIICDARKE